jgi:hypothetical protein
MATIATILSVAEATHYLVGMSDDNNQLVALPDEPNIQMCDSLAQAKQVLREHHFMHAQLVMQTAYDEMCGLSAPSETKQMIPL